MRKNKRRYSVFTLLLLLLLCSCNEKENPEVAPTAALDGDGKVTQAVTQPLDNPGPTTAPIPSPTVAPTPTDEDFSDPLYGQVYEQEPIEGLPVYAVAEPESIAVEINKEFSPGQMERMNCAVVPRNAYGRLKFTSSDENVAVVNEYGVVTALNAGDATITATAPNGVNASCTITVNSNYAELTFELMDDGTGYVITGCDKKALTANIPATYNGKPVKEIAGRAFIDCEKLRFFTTDSEQEIFYAVDGVLYTDEPEKTLVRMPNAYRNEYQTLGTYTVLPGTKAIGDYAFAGYGKEKFGGLELFLPEGLTTMGNYVFTEISNQTAVYVPDSLTTIGKDITLNQYGNVPFFGNSGCYAETFCDKNNIPFGGYFIPAGDYSKEAETFVPVSSSAEGYTVPEKSQIAFVEPAFYAFSNRYSWEKVNISNEQKKGKEEVRILFEYAWQDRIPDKYGNKVSSFPAVTGLYGMGYTEEDCKLVAYAIDGKPIATMDVNKGDFVFSFNGAVNLGVVGGKNTVIQAIPDEPIFVLDSGYINLKPEIWHISDYNTGYKTIISCYQKANYDMKFPQTINVVSYMVRDSVGAQEKNTTHFNSVSLEWNDNTRLDQSDLWHVYCDGVEKIYDSTTLECYAKKTLETPYGYGNKVETILNMLKETMVGKYFPTDVAINKIAVYLDGSYPSCGSSTVYLDDICADVNTCKSTYTHELVHAIDQSIPFCDIIAPTPWMEGRAEYISSIVNKKLGVGGTYYAEKGDWSFLTEQDKADFLHYYCLNYNRETPYFVGYYFIKYLNETYGDDITAKIMEAMSKVTVPTNYSEIDDEKRMNMFGDIVKSVTCDTVFQDFVRDVVEK